MTSYIDIGVVNIPTPPPAYAGWARGAVNYTYAELMGLLHLMERIVPVDARGWQDVCEQHCIQLPGRMVDSLKRKYTLTHCKKALTGDPDIPPELKSCIIESSSSSSDDSDIDSDNDK